MSGAGRPRLPVLLLLEQLAGTVVVVVVVVMVVVVSMGVGGCGVCHVRGAGVTSGQRAGRPSGLLSQLHH